MVDTVWYYEKQLAASASDELSANLTVLDYSSVELSSNFSVTQLSGSGQLSSNFTLQNAGSAELSANFQLTPEVPSPSTQRSAIIGETRYGEFRLGEFVGEVDSVQLSANITVPAPPSGSDEISATFSVQFENSSDLSANFSLPTIVSIQYAAIIGETLYGQYLLGEGPEIAVQVSASFSVGGISASASEPSANFTVLNKASREISANATVYYADTEELSANLTLQPASSLEISSNFTITGVTFKQITSNFTIFRVGSDELSANLNVGVKVFKQLSANFRVGDFRRLSANVTVVAVALTQLSANLFVEIPLHKLTIRG